MMRDYPPAMASEDQARRASLRASGSQGHLNPASSKLALQYVKNVYRGDEALEKATIIVGISE
jgi:hypothetical protein